MNDDTPHGRLIGVPDEQLRALAPEATHQHRKGGLYRDLGIAYDADTKLPLKDAAGNDCRAWLHIHPHPQALYVRSVAEDDRYRPLQPA